MLFINIWFRLHYLLVALLFNDSVLFSAFSQSYGVIPENKVPRHPRISSNIQKIILYIYIYIILCCFTKYFQYFFLTQLSTTN